MRVEFLVFGIIVCIGAAWRLTNMGEDWLNGGMYEAFAYGVIALVAFTAAFWPQKDR